MYVCLCHAVTESDIQTAVEQGVCTMRELRNELKVATQCGRCAPCARACLNHTLAEIAEDQGMAA